MILVMSVFLYNWSLQQAKKTGEELEARTDPLVCSEIGISVEGICQDYNHLEINITNTNNLEISGFQLRTVGLYPEDEDYIYSDTLVYNIEPGETEKIIIIKKGTLSQAQIIPYATKNKKNIFCEDQSITKEKNELKQC
jgi:hypothetical protein